MDRIEDGTFDNYIVARVFVAAVTSFTEPFPSNDMRIYVQTQTDGRDL
jgi:hypothetical protein